MPSHDYRSIVQALPRPSPAQCERFVRHVAAARRWYALLPADGGVSCLVFLDPRAGQQPPHDTAENSAQGDPAPSAIDQYLELFGHLNYIMPAPRGPDASILDADGRSVALPADLLAVATCSLNATIHPNAAALLETLPARVPAPLRPPDVTASLTPIQADIELQGFARAYVEEELAGFQCPDDRAAWELRQLQAFQLLYARRHAEQIARLQGALDEMLSWVYDR